MTTSPPPPIQDPPPAQPSGDGEPAPSLHMGLGARLRAYFFAGILVTAPVSITFYIAWQFIQFMDNQVSPLIPPAWNPQNWGIPGFGLLMVVLSLTVIGMFTAGFAGRLFVKLSEAVLQRMPVIRSIYSAIKQIFETVLAQKTNAFREVVLVEYPRHGMWVLGFIAGTTNGEVGTKFEGEMVNVFVPTTPNPTSGFLVFVPRKDVVVLDMTIEDGIKMVVSTGIIAPPAKAKARAATPPVSQTATS